ncbi:plasmid pRiA4b ORF-3 family protein [bacterium]|nr:plasmid pRiA4b ORF-3 family protein [bacterium]
MNMQPIKKNEVTKVIENFHIFCEYVKTHPTYLTTNLQELGKKDCFEINRLLQYPRTFDAPKYLMTSYPTIAMYFQLVHNLGIFEFKSYRKGKHKGKIQLIPTNLYNIFFKMEDLTKYIVLFWGYWVNSIFQYLYKDTLFFDGVEDILTQGIESIKEAKPNVKLAIDFDPENPRNSSDLPYSFWFLHYGTSIHHLRDFGFWEYEEAFSRKFYASTREIHVQSITPSPLGIAMMKCCRKFPLPICNRYYKESQWLQNKDLLQPTHHYATSFAEAFEPLFPGLIPLGLNEPVHNKEKNSKKKGYKTMSEKIGTVSIKVSLQKSYRVIKISFHHTLEDLHLAIQSAFNFDNDHLYAFHMDGDVTSRYDVYWGGYDEAPFASDTLIQQFNWAVGQIFIYHFDFGDDWFFKCQVVEVNPDELMNGYPIIVKAKGEPPEQYPMEEEEA